MNREPGSDLDDQPYLAPWLVQPVQSNGHRLFGPQRYRAVPWTIWEILLLAPMVVSSIWQGLLRRDQEETRAFTVFNVIAVLLVLAVPFLLVVVRHAKPYQMGLHTSHFWRNAWVGFLSIFIAAPLVILTNWWALQFFEQTPHQIVDALTKSPTVQNFVLMAFSAVVIAPILEEVTFRGILLPWLRRVCGAWPAILLSSAVFAIAHFHAWPSPIPLFVLALFLGFLAHRTSSLVAPIVLHATFNAANMTILILALVTKAIPLE
jgi:membrane protease YdiL (CAAX protease family)